MPVAGRSCDEPIVDEEFSIRIDSKTAAEVERLIKELGSHHFPVREESTAELLQIGASAFRQLRNAYLHTDDLEVRLRIEQIVRTSYIDYHVYGRYAFLGVRHRNEIATHNDHPRIRDGHMGIVIDRVENGTAAEQARLQRDDVIVDVADKPFRYGSDPGEVFGQTIRKHKPGERVMLTVLRSGNVMQIHVTLGRCPKRYVEESGSMEAVTRVLDSTWTRFGSWWMRNFHDTSEEKEMGRS